MLRTMTLKAPKPNVFKRFTRKVSQALGKAKLKRAKKRIARQAQILSAKSTQAAIIEEKKAASKAVQAATVQVSTPKVPVAKLIAGPSRVAKVPEYPGDYRLITDPRLRELEISRIDRVIAQDRRAGIHNFYPDVLARMQERNMKIPDTPERIRNLHGWYLKPSELTPKAAPTTMLHHDIGETFVGGARKRTSKHNNKKRTHKT
jgi:hypothetical protein